MTTVLAMENGSRIESDTYETFIYMFHPVQKHAGGTHPWQSMADNLEPVSQNPDAAHPVRVQLSVAILPHSVV